MSVSALIHRIETSSFVFSLSNFENRIDCFNNFQGFFCLSYFPFIRHWIMGKLPVFVMNESKKISSRFNWKCIESCFRKLNVPETCTKHTFFIIKKVKIKLDLGWKVCEHNVAKSKYLFVLSISYAHNKLH